MTEGEVSRVPAWLDALMDQRIALMREHGVIFAEMPIVMTAVQEPEEDTPEAFSRWERTCDRCGKHCPDEFYTGTTTRIVDETQVVFTFGMCPECKAETT